MTRLDQVELNTLLQELREGKYWKVSGGAGVPIEDDPSFKKLLQIANRERHRENNDSRIKNSTDFRWQDLCSMREEAERFAVSDPKRFLPVIDMIKREQQRRLLRLTET